MGFGSGDGFTPGRNHISGDFTATGQITASLGVSASAFYGDGSNLTGISGGGGSGVTVGSGVTSGTGNRVLYEDSSNEIAESANFTFDGTTVTALSVSASNGVSGSVVEGGSLRLAGTNISATPAELNYVDGVTSAIQTQLDGKSATTGNSNIATVGTITAGTWQGTAIANTYIANSDITFGSDAVSLGSTVSNLSVAQLTGSDIVSGSALHGETLALAGAATLSAQTATRLLATDGTKNVVSSDLHNWVAGTANQITVTNDSDGTITLSAPQDLNSSARPTFLTITGSAGLSGSLVEATTVNVGENVNVGGNVDVEGVLSVDGNTTLGDAPADTLTIKAVPSIVGSTDSTPADLYFKADNSGGDDDIDNWLVRGADGGSLSFNNMASTSYVAQLTLYPHATQTDSLTKAEGQFLAAGGLFLAQGTATNAGATNANLTATNLLTRIIYGDPSGSGCVYHLDTAANIVSSLGAAIGSSNTAGMAFDVSVINLNGATNGIEIDAGAAGLTMVGDEDVDAGKSGGFRFHVTNAASPAVTVYRIS